MKSNQKNLKMNKILQFTVLFVSALLMSNCQTEDLTAEKNQHSHAEDRNKISLSIFKKETGITNFNAITTVAISEDITGKVEPSNFIIDTLYAKRHISDIGESTYSFRIYPILDHTDLEKKYNLIYRKVNNIWHTSIVSFKVQLNVSSQGEISITDFENLYDSQLGEKSMMCIEETFSIQCDGSCHGSCDGFACPTGQCIKHTISTVPCGGGGGPSTGGGGINPGGGGTNPGGGGTNPGAGVTNPGGGGSAPVNPYQFTPNMWENPVFDDPNYLKAVRAQLLYDYVSLINATQWASNNQAAYLQLTNWLVDSYTVAKFEAAKELIDVLKEYQQVDLNALGFLLEAEKLGKMPGLDDNYIASAVNYMDLDVSDHTLQNPVYPIVEHFAINYAILKYKHPQWSKWKLYYEASRDLVHLSLDLFGLAPVIGEVADLVNGTLYLIHGENKNALLSYAGAVPFAGWAATGVKYAVKIKTVSTIGTKVRLTWKVLADGKIYFGANSTCRAQLRKVLGLLPGNTSQAHHIIPLNLQENIIIQKAAKSADAFHMNEALNGIPLTNAVHNGSHFAYDTKIAALLNELPANASPTQCYNKVEEVINKVRIAIANNPNTPLNQLDF